MILPGPVMQPFYVDEHGWEQGINSSGETLAYPSGEKVPSRLDIGFAGTIRSADGALGGTCRAAGEVVPFK
jgi:hypothetical protein